MTLSPSGAVDRQVEAYNARDLAAFCACFAQDVVVAVPDGPEIARGQAELREVYSRRFSSCPDLACETFRRIELGELVIDHERVRGIERGLLEVVAIYQVRDGLIRRLWLLRGEGRE